MIRLVGRENSRKEQQEEGGKFTVKTKDEKEDSKQLTT